jgi:hypothetical protein
MQFREFLLVDAAFELALFLGHGTFSRVSLASSKNGSLSRI